MKSQYCLIIIISLIVIPSLPSECLEFIDVTEQAHVSGTGIGNGIAFVDYDNDGDLDLYVSSDPHDIFYRNNGDGTFTDATDELGIKVRGDGIGVAFGDYDNDGDLDLYIPVNDGPDIFYQNEGGRLFRDITRAVRIDNPGRARSASFADFDLDGFLDIFVVNEGSPNILYRNKSGQFFEDVTDRMGLNIAGPGRCSIWGDYDNDGDPDLYVTYKGASNKLYRNDRIGFTDVTEKAGVGGTEDSIGAAFADYDNDGNLDLFVANGQSCLLFHNNGDGTFVNQADFAGITNSGQRCTPTFADFDNDGFLDLYLSVWQGKSVLYRNNGNGTFTDITDQSGMGAFGNSWSATAGDYDNDGDIDLYTSFTTRNNILYENKGNDNNWLFVKVIGSLSNTSGIGVKVQITTDETTQIREVSGGTGYGSLDSLILEFGLGTAETVKHVDVFWTSGIHTTLSDIEPNRLITIEEGLSAVVPPTDGRTEVQEPEIISPKIPELSQDQSITCLMQNYPNPFNPETWIPFQIADPGNIALLIYDSTGKLIKRLDLGYRNKGIYVTKSRCAFWDGRNEEGELVSSGVYFYELRTESKTYIKKMILSE